VTYKDEILFCPEDGMLNLAVGKEITSAYAGPADCYSFDLVFHESDSKTVKPVFSKRERTVQDLYEKVRHYREEDKINKPLLEKLKAQVENNYPEQWLLIEEIDELIA
jgi:phenylalanine-4-hydroxylase